MRKLNIVKKLKAALVVLFSLAYLFPLYIAITNSFKNYDDILLSPLSLPFKFTFNNFVEAWNKSHLGELYLNSIIITVVSVALTIALSAMIAFIIARSNKRHYKMLYTFFLAGFMIPPQVILIPSLKTLKFLNLLHTFPGLFFFYVATYMSISIFFYVEFIRTIPTSIDESGVIDGAGKFTIFFRLVFPLLKPCTATVLIFLGMWIWNDFLPPMYILGSNNGRTITTGIYSAVGQQVSAWNVVFACAVMASAPIIAIFIMMQKQFMKGLTAGAVKG